MTLDLDTRRTLDTLTYRWLAANPPLPGTDAEHAAACVTTWTLDARSIGRRWGAVALADGLITLDDVADAFGRLRAKGRAA